MSINSQTTNFKLKHATSGKLNHANGGAATIYPGDPGQVVLLDGGTTTLQVARHLSLDLQATFVTNSPPVAIALLGPSTH